MSAVLCTCFSDDLYNKYIFCDIVAHAQISTAPLECHIKLLHWLVILGNCSYVCLQVSCINACM